MNTCFTHATFAETSGLKLKKKKRKKRKGKKKKHAIMLKAHLTSGHLGVATLEFHIYPTS